MRDNWFLLFSDDIPHSQKLKQFYDTLFKSRWTVLCLLLLGLLRVGLFLFAYAPADGADAGDYYAYAAFIGGVDIPDRAANVSPMYPIFIYFAHYVVGQFDVAILMQLVMSSSLGLITYLGLRHLNAFLACLVALIVSFDAQTGVIFNFTSTEPLYIFFLVVMFAIMASTRRDESTLWKPIALGITLFLISETRTIGTYLIIPVLGLYGLYTLDLKRISLAVGSTILSIIIFAGITSSFQIQQTSTTNMLMYSRPLLVHDLLIPDAGPASEQVAALLEGCDTSIRSRHISACVEEQLSEGEEAVGQLYRDAYIEALQADPMSFVSAARTAFYNYIRMSGQQYMGTPTPAVVQCADIESRVRQNIDYILTVEWRAVNMSAEQTANYRQVMLDFGYEMCPAAFENDTARLITDFIATHYRWLSPQNPYLVHAILIALIVTFVWARKYWYVYSLATGVWLYHALISTIFLNIQPRYVVVTNTMRAFIIGLLIFLLLQLLIRLMYTFTERSGKSTTP